MHRPASTAVLLVFLLLTAPSCAEAEIGSEADRQAIHAAGKAYQEALSRGDVAALAKLWSPDGDIVDEAGTMMLARDMLAAEAEASKNGVKPPSITLSETSLRFLSPDVAVEDGTAEVGRPGASGRIRGRFTAGWVRSDGLWKLGFLREAKVQAASDRPQLSDLEPLVGTWRPTGDDRSIRVVAAWNRDKTFLLRTMTVTTEDKREIEISQRIGIDPVSGQLRSWNFSSDGGHGEGVWSRDGDAWVVHTTAVAPNGVRTTSFNVYAFEDGNRLRWRSFPTSVAAGHTPPVDMVLEKE